MSKTKIVIGAIIGAAAGIIAGMLTAPKSGKETRADLKDKASELKANAARKAEIAKGRVEDVVDDVKAKADTYKERGEKAKQDLTKE